MTSTYRSKFVQKSVLISSISNCANFSFLVLIKHSLQHFSLGLGCVICTQEMYTSYALNKATCY